MRKKLTGWCIGIALAVTLALASAYSTRNVYTKPEVDAKIEHVEKHLDRMEGKIDTLIEHLIEE